MTEASGFANSSDRETQEASFFHSVLGNHEVNRWTTRQAEPRPGVGQSTWRTKPIHGSMFLKATACYMCPAVRLPDIAKHPTSQVQT